MSKGFITLGINTDKDRIFHCYGLACSIKHSDPDSKICLVVDKGKVDFVKKELTKLKIKPVYKDNTDLSENLKNLIS